jgi:hypothetical protein
MTESTKRLLVPSSHRDEMFIECATSNRFFLAPWERNVLRTFPSSPETLRSAGARVVVKRFYKHLAPLEPGIACDD